MKRRPLKTKSNQKSAGKSTGPTSPEGKQVVALNGIAHGLRSVKPVIPWLETEENWQAHRRGFVEQLAPVGAIELALTDRIALGFWRLARCVESEPRILNAVREKRRWRAIGNALVVEHLKMVGESPETVFLRLVWERDRLCAISDLWQAILDNPGRNKPDPQAANWLIDSICRTDNWAELVEEFGEAFDWPPTRMSDLRAMVDWIMLRIVDDPMESVPVFAEGALARATEARARVARIENEAAQAAELALVESDAVEKLMRYETTIHRTLQKDLHELQRIQALRQGLPVVAPIALDLATDS